jgi:hypothetical protein
MPNPKSEEKPKHTVKIAEESSHFKGEPYIRKIYRAKYLKPLKNLENLFNTFDTFSKKIPLELSEGSAEREKEFGKISKSFEEEYKNLKVIGKPTIFCVVPVNSLETLKKLANSIEPPAQITQKASENFFGKKDWLGRPIVVFTTTYECIIGNTVFEYHINKEKVVSKDYLKTLNLQRT